MTMIYIDITIIIIIIINVVGDASNLMLRECRDIDGCRSCRLRFHGSWLLLIVEKSIVAAALIVVVVVIIIIIVIIAGATIIRVYNLLG